jgi:hypothetical protein
MPVALIFKINPKHKILCIAVSKLAHNRPTIARTSKNYPNSVSIIRIVPSRKNAQGYADFSMFSEFTRKRWMCKGKP